MNTLFIISFVVGAIIIAAGWILSVFPPTKINGFYGYRTRSSMQSQEKWDFAQKYSAKEMMKLGGLLIACSLLGLLFRPSEVLGTILGLALMILMIVVLIVRVEKAIKKEFKE